MVRVRAPEQTPTPLRRWQPTVPFWSTET